MVGSVVLISIIFAYFAGRVLRLFTPALMDIPLFIKLCGCILITSIFVTQFISKGIFEPIYQLREGMQKVADGDFNNRIESNSSSVEVQEILAGFNMMAQELSSIEILQTDFVSNVSHEIKTPINAIEGYATLLQDCENIDPNQQEYIEKILFNTKRLSTLVSNMLLLTKIENQSIQTHQEWYRLDEQVRESIVALESTWEAKNIKLDIDLDDIKYYGNGNMMYHVWANLFDNAVKFSSVGGMVKIRLHKKNKKIIFMIEDNGPGLSEEAQKHLFDKFYQADSSHKQEGNGLGLALVKRILTISGGNIYVKNIATGGCRFTVTLNEN